MLRPCWLLDGGPSTSLHPEPGDWKLDPWWRPESGRGRCSEAGGGTGGLWAHPQPCPSSETNLPRRADAFSVSLAVCLCVTLAPTADGRPLLLLWAGPHARPGCLPSSCPVGSARWAGCTSESACPHRPAQGRTGRVLWRACGTQSAFQGWIAVIVSVR